MSSEPMFSGDDYDDPFNLTEPVHFKARGTHAPAWYQKHANPRGTLVVKDGKPIPPGFMVSEVAPERRWAIGEKGEVMDELTFQEHHLKWWIEFYTLRGGAVPIDPGARAIPRIEKFVSVRVDPINPERTEPITRPPGTEQPFQPRVQFDADGLNPVAPVMEVKDAEGNVTGFEAVGDRADVAEAVREAREQLMAELDEAEAEEKPETPAAATPEVVEMVTARCGAQVAKRKHGPHVRFQCKECKRLKAIEDAEQALNGGK